MRRSRTIAAVDTHAEGEIARPVTVAGRPAVVPTIAGRAWVNGIYRRGLDPGDPFPEGFRLDDGSSV